MKAIWKRAWIWVSMIAVIVGVISIHAQQDSCVLKIATLAPEGSVWVEQFKAMNAELDQLTSGRVKFKVYPGGIMGDDDVVMRKIRVGQLDGSCFTSNALCKIYEDFQALVMPDLFNNSDEVDHLIHEMGADLSNAFQKAGFQSLGIAGNGFTYMFNRNKISEPADLQRMKPWLWQGDIIMSTLYHSAEVTPVSVGIGDVMTALQTGLLDTVFNTPTGILALQWFTKVNFMTDYPLTYSFGAFLLDNRSWSRVPDDMKPVVQATVDKYMKEITARIRQEDLHARDIITQKGVQIIPPNGALTEKIHQISSSARDQLVGKVVSPEFTQRILTIIRDFREKESPDKDA